MNFGWAFQTCIIFLRIQKVSRSQPVLAFNKAIEVMHNTSIGGSVNAKR